MKLLPPEVVATRRSPVYTNDSMPESLVQSHRTTARTWASIKVVSGRLRYRRLDAPRTETVLSPDRPGVVQPEERHQVEPLGPVRFYLEFFQLAPEGPRTRVPAGLTEEYRLRGEHVNFHLLLDLLEQQVDTFERAARPDYELMEDIVRYMREYPDRSHHPREDLIFARLANADAALAPVVATLKRQHELLARSGGRLLESLQGAVSGVMLPREALEQPGRDYIAIFRRHMAMEENALFPLLTERLSDSDWTAIESSMSPGSDPLFGRASAERYERLSREIGGFSAQAG